MKPRSRLQQQSTSLLFHGKMHHVSMIQTSGHDPAGGLGGANDLDLLESLHAKLRSLTIFRGLLDDPVLRLLPAMLLQGGKSTAEKIDDYAVFASRLFFESDNLTDYVWDRVLTNENVYVRKCARHEQPGPILEECLRNELKILEEASQLHGREIKKGIGFEGYLAEWGNRRMDFVRDYRYMIGHIPTLGYGPFLKHRMFSVADRQIIPVKSPDSIRLSDLKGYEAERQAVIDNTLALLNGRPAANALLYGDAGTGKSSTVKAVVNEFADRGLRLIEIRKTQLLQIPSIIEGLHQSPLKFILFIDDLSFAKNNEEIGALKAVLEGGAAAITSNIAIYATSNRRHLIHETFSDRGDDDVHRNETMQEQVSLSDRFGLSVSFFKPDKEKYLTIVNALARQYGVADTAALDLKAEQYALERGGRSPRAARQFIEYLKSFEE